MITKTKDTITKTTTTVIEYDIKLLTEELLDIKSEMAEIEKEPDNLKVLNEEKFLKIDSIKSRIDEIENILK